MIKPYFSNSRKAKDDEQKDSSLKTILTNDTTVKKSTPTSSATSVLRGQMRKVVEKTALSTSSTPRDNKPMTLDRIQVMGNFTVNMGGQDGRHLQTQPQQRVVDGNENIEMGNANGRGR